MSSSLLLASKGVPSLTVERHPGTAIHPRAAMFNQRTIEIYRSVGIEPEIVEASALEFEQDGAIVSVEALAGKELEYYFRNVNEGYEPLSLVAAAVHHPDRARADPPPSRRRAWRTPRVRDGPSPSTRTRTA